MANWSVVPLTLQVKSGHENVWLALDHHGRSEAVHSSISLHLSLLELNKTY